MNFEIRAVIYYTYINFMEMQYKCGLIVFVDCSAMHCQHFVNFKTI